MKTVRSITRDFQVSETILLLEADQEFGERKNVEEVREAEYGGPLSLPFENDKEE